MDDLTDPQRAAVEHIDGPLLVLAGPGSGKTRVMTRRVAHLVEQGVRPREILAITFTNKAAGEMAERVAALLPENRIWISTFHRFCARMLRRYADVVGLQSNYSILSKSDQKQALKTVLHDLDIDAVHYSPDKVAWQISQAKNDLISPEQFAARYEESIADHWQAVVKKAYPAYQKLLLDSNSVDFDDLLLLTAQLLAENEELRLSLDDRFRYILVDEYQDTNMAQYQIVAALSQRTPNLCVTGDPDQSIYGWRGARIENILRFERDFPQAKIIRLEHNFRSTQAILRSADQLIAYNSRRKDKRLISASEEGAPVSSICYSDESAEAEGIAQTIERLVAEGDFAYRDIAIFYRVNSLSRHIEFALMRHRIPFQVAAGVAFYERAEVQDMLAYLRLVQNPRDRAAFVRIVNTPLRGLGQTSRQRLERFADDEGITLLEATERAADVPKLSKRAIAGFRRFGQMIAGFSLADAGSVALLLERIIEETGYIRSWQDSPVEKDQQRLANVHELVNVARQYDAVSGDDASLEGFLEQTSLVNELDSVDARAGQVTLMTLHAAKGLEFPAVFIVGLEEGLLPHERAIKNASRHEWEEERRLLFVGVTRARQRLYLTSCRLRSMHGRTMPTIPSPFLAELGCETQDLSNDDPFGRSYGEAEPSEFQPSPPATKKTESQVPVKQPSLITGADLLNGTANGAVLPQGFAQGAEVRHPRYGRGTVIEVGGFGARRTVTVRFSESDRTETFIASKAPLQPVGRR